MCTTRTEQLLCNIDSYTCLITSFSFKIIIVIKNIVNKVIIICILLTMWV